jgi:hypothetical protein
LLLRERACGWRAKALKFHENISGEGTAICRVRPLQFVRHSKRRFPRKIERLPKTNGVVGTTPFLALSINPHPGGDQPGQTDKPLQPPRVKFAFSFDEPPAISSASSETSKERISSSVISSVDVIFFIALVLLFANIGYQIETSERK